MPRKCKLCGKFIQNNEYDTNCTTYDGGYIHISPCFDIAMKMTIQKKNSDLKKNTNEKKKETKPRAELKNRVSEEDYKEKKQYYDYIHQYVEKIPAKVYITTQKYIDQYNFTYEFMLKTLKYIREILEKDIIDDGVGLIPYYYDEAQQFYKQVNDVEKNNKGKNINNMYKTNIVYINPKKRQIKQLDILDIKEEK